MKRFIENHNNQTASWATLSYLLDQQVKYSYTTNHNYADFDEFVDKYLYESSGMKISSDELKKYISSPAKTNMYMYISKIRQEKNDSGYSLKNLKTMIGIFLIRVYPSGTTTSTIDDNALSLIDVFLKKNITDLQLKIVAEPKYSDLYIQMKQLFDNQLLHLNFIKNKAEQIKKIFEI